MSDAGLGAAPLGRSPFGYGAPLRANSTTARLFLDASGQRRNAVQIDTVTGDYVRDAAGVHRGMESVGQQVYLALRTLKESSIVRDLGIAFHVKTISETTKQKVNDAVLEALLPLTSRSLVRLDKLDVERVKMTAIRVIVTWTNLTNNETNVSRWENG